MLTQFNLSQIISRTETQRLQLDGKMGVLRGMLPCLGLSAIQTEIVTDVSNTGLPVCVTPTLTLWANAQVTT